MSTYNVLEMTRDAGGNRFAVVSRDDSQLPAGDVVIDIQYSDLNYKDGLFMIPESERVRTLPFVPGIDCVGTVVAAGAPKLAVGDVVTVNSLGFGTDRDGGLAQRTRVPHEMIVPVPAAIDAFSAAAYGTAGYTASLAVIALQKHDIVPDAGPVLVTGASGGAGSIAVMLLGALGYEVVASSGRKDEEEQSLLDLGASSVIGRIGDERITGPVEPRWAAVIDTVGGDTLSNAIAQTRYLGAVAAMGMAQGLEFTSSVIPFIIRGVTLIGIDSVSSPMSPRIAAWQLLADAGDAEKLARITRTIALDEAPQAATDIIAGRVRGRLVVDVNRTTSTVTAP